MLGEILIGFGKLIIFSYALLLAMALLLGSFIDIEQVKENSKKLKQSVDELKTAMSESLKLEQIADWINLKLK